MDFLTQPPRNLFFTGKGGVGKTSMACASAVQLADRGSRVLVVSTDPASNLDEVLETALSASPLAVSGVPNLFAMNLNPEAAAREYRERMVGPYRGVLPDAAIQSMEEQFSGSCTVEIAAFDEFAKLLGDPAATSHFDHVIFDTAPTGHTLRLLTLPSAWTGYIENNTTGTSCLGPLAGLQDQAQIYRQTVDSLSDASLTTLILVTRPESSAFREAARTSQELHDLGVRNQHLIINGVFTSDTTSDSVAMAMQRRGDIAMAEIPAVLAELERTVVPLSGESLMGVEFLRRVGNRRVVGGQPNIEPVRGLADTPGLGDLIDDLAAVGHGVILAMGKGGVGKTTVAAAVAVALADRGFKVHLSTTDPAAHLSATFADKEFAKDNFTNDHAATGDVYGLTVGRIDPAEETAQYTNEVINRAGKDLDAQGKALLEEDLRSPCTEEIAVFRAFANVVSAGKDGFVVLDTAPTGHTILLLDSALAYHREVDRQSDQMPESVENLLPRLRDPQFTRVLVVTLPEATPVHEAERLQEDLRRAKIKPFAWVINQSLASLELTDTILRQRQHGEIPFINAVSNSLATRTIVIPWQKDPPAGLSGLRRILDP